MTHKLWEMLDLLNAKGWSKRALEEQDGSHCLLGAARMVHCGTVHTAGLEQSTIPDVTAMRDVIREQFPERVVFHGTIYEVSDFNNHPDTTLEEVLRVVEKAAIRTDEVLA